MLWIILGEIYNQYKNAPHHFWLVLSFLQTLIVIEQWDFILAFSHFQFLMRFQNKLDIL